LSLVNSFQAHSSYIWRIKQSPFNKNTNYVATCSLDATVKIWNVSSSFDWTLITTYSQNSSGVFSLEWLDKDTLASVDFQTIKLWSMATGQTKRTIQANQYVGSLTMLNTNIHLAAGVGRDINIYNINDGNLVSTLEGHTSSVNDLVQISADLLASSNDDGTVRIWNLTTNTCKFIIRHTSSVFGIKQITSSILASGSSDQTIKLWDMTSGLEIRTLRGHTNAIQWSVDLLNSQTLVSGAINGEIKLWNWSTGECLSTIQAIDSWIGISSLAVIDTNPQQQQTATTTTTVSSKLSLIYISLIGQNPYNRLNVNLKF
jgi:WD40 repeat protein